MAEEAKPKPVFPENVFDSLAGGIEHIIEPKKDTLWHTITHKWISLDAWLDYLGEKGVSRGLLLVGLFIPLFFTAQALEPTFLRLVAGWLLLGVPVIAPVGTWMIFWALWMWYVQSDFAAKREYVLLEMKIPAEISKSPRAMEQVFAMLHVMKNETTEIDKLWKGGQRPYFSFELVSLGGEIHFYIFTRTENRNLVETAIYSQYPEVEIVEAEDYAMKFVLDDTKGCAASEFELKSGVKDVETDPLNPASSRANAYQPKTYIDFELDKDPKEEYRVDPYASVMEALSAMNKNEQAWVQIVIRQHKDKDWQKTLESEVERIRVESTKTSDEKDTSRFPRPTWRQNEQIRNIERHMSKLPFEVGMRAIYIHPSGKVRGTEWAGIRYIWRPFANPLWGGRIHPVRLHNIFDYPWQDWNGIRDNLFARRALDAYRRRCIFQYPWKTTYNIVSNETLATLFHPPSSTSKAPGLRRIPTSKAEAPANLPI